MFAVAVLVSGSVSHVIQAVDSDFGVANLPIVDFPLFETIAEAYGHRGQTDVAAWWNEMGAAAALSFHGVAAVRFYG